MAYIDIDPTDFKNLSEVRRKEELASRELANKMFQEVKSNRDTVNTIHNLFMELKELDLLYFKIDNKHYNKQDLSYLSAFMRQLASDIKEGKIVLNRE